MSPRGAQRLGPRGAQRMSSFKAPRLEQRDLGGLAGNALNLNSSLPVPGERRLGPSPT